MAGKRCEPGCTCRRHSTHNHGDGRKEPFRAPLELDTIKTCTKCRQAKPLSEFSLSRQATEATNAVYRSHCKRCQSDQALQWFRDNPERTKANGRRQKLQKLYGLTVEQYQAILSDQGGGCGICGAETNPNGHLLAVDHDHGTQEVRGILCHRCNRAIGLLGDDTDLLKKAIYYLERAGGHN